MPETLYIIDGHSQIFRAYYAPFGDLTSPTGEPTRATHVFCAMLLKLINEKKPRLLAMAADGPAEKLHRKKLYPDYKVSRKPTPEDLPVQIGRIMQIVEAMGVPILQVEGYEADDIIATAVEKFGRERSLVLVSRDKDLDQLLDSNVVLYDPMKDETFDAAAVERAKGYPPAKALDVQALMGDAIDNIPGIPGVGPKKAASLVQKYGSAEAVVQHADELTPKLSENVKAHAETIPLAKQLARLDRNVPIELDLEAMKFDQLPGDRVRPIFAELGFNRLLDQLDKLGIGGESSADHAALAEAQQQTTAEQFTYECIDTVDKLEALGERLADVRRISLDTETTGLRPMWASLVGISLSWEPCSGVYLPVKAPLGQRVLELDDVRRVLGPILADEKVEKVNHNLKFDMLVLENVGMSLRGPMFDTLIAAHVLDSTRMTYKLDALAAELLAHRCIPIEDLIGRGKNQLTMDHVPLEVITRYAAEDSDMALRLADVLARDLKAEGLDGLFNDLEMPLMPVLADMERLGVRVDPAALKTMEVELAKQADVLRGRILAAAGCDFNPDSPKQLAEVLFERLGLPVIKKTKTGASTDVGVLEELASRHELPGLVLDYRRLTKLLGTYLTSLAQCIHATTCRIHTSFNQCGTATGRLSSSDPNLQNIPVRTEEGRQIRSAFVADEGFKLLAADYSQIELRVMAHMSGDATLLEAFRSDQDIHRIVAAEVFAVSADSVTPDMRARAKTVNFGIVYGQTAFGLARTLRISRTEAGEFIRRYRQRFPKIDEFLAQCVAKAKADGYVETIFGRRRLIPDIDSRNPAKRAMAERLAINSVVQGSAADLIKQAMVNIARRIDRENRPSRMLLQIHDELVFEIPADAVQAERKMIVEEMSRAIELSVPLKVDVGVGDNWLEAK
jgi:DNA polymerase-1